MYVWIYGFMDVCMCMYVATYNQIALDVAARAKATAATATVTEGPTGVGVPECMCMCIFVLCVLRVRGVYVCMDLWIYGCVHVYVCSM